MIIGAGDAGAAIIKENRLSKAATRKVCCLIDKDPKKWGRYILGCPVVGGADKIMESVEKYKIQKIVIAIPSATSQQIKELVEICKETKCELKILPGIYQLIDGEVSISQLREVEIEDLLGREPVKVDLEEILGYIQGKTVLVTGGGGSIGSEICRQLAGHGVGKLIIFDVYENNAYAIQQELKRKYPNLNLEVLIGSVRNTSRMNDVFATYHPEIVFHAAAHKHVPLMEDSPNEAIKNNVIGTYKTAKMASDYGVKKFILISTDKAVNPTNIMGASKRLCEMVIQTIGKKSQTEFAAVRFGNVLGSNGSVIPLFKEQIKNGGPVTVTHKDIIRYFMTIPEAVSLVLQAGAYAKNGEIFVLNMGEPVKIVDLARNLIKLAGVKQGDRVFCSDLTFDATVNPVVYEGGIPVFIDTEDETWNMDPVALEKAFEIYPEVKVVVLAHLYGVPGKIDEIRAICERYGALIIEDAAESFGATYKGKQTGTFGSFNCISFNGNKIITGSAGGMLLTDDKEAAEKVRKWSTQSRENAPWYQHEELGYNYRMSNVIAGVVRGQLPYLEEHITQKKEIYMRYKEGFKDLPVTMNPYDSENSEPNFWLSCLLINEEAMCKQVRGEQEALYISEAGKSCPTEILEILAKYNAEGRPIWKPMHMQPIYRMNPFVTREGNGRAKSNAYIWGSTVGKDSKPLDVGMDLFQRGLCLPSDNKMTSEQQDIIIQIVKKCFE